VTITEVMRDRNLLGPWFSDPSWSPWEAFLEGLYGLPMEESGLNCFRRHTGGREPREGGFNEAWVICGRRGGKSKIAALVAAYQAAFIDYASVCGPGEMLSVQVLATDQRQGEVVHGYIAGFFEHCGLLTRLVAARRERVLILSNQVRIEVRWSNYRTIRGFTVAAAICDELAFWRDESSVNPVREVLSALRPGMATVPGAKLLCISSPYARTGELWEAYRRHYGQDSPVLVWKATSQEMNSSLPQGIIEEAMEVDPVAARSEYFAEFRTDVEGLLSLESVEACISSGTLEIPREIGFRYVSFCDPSGGSSDSMTLGIAKANGSGEAELVCLRERRPPFDPASVVDEFCKTLEDYGLDSVTGDRYAGEWVARAFADRRVSYSASPLSRSELYLELVPLMNSRRVRILDNRRLQSQLLGLERRASRSGKDIVDHATGKHDDLANAAAGALVLAARKRTHRTPSEAVGVL